MLIDDVKIKISAGHGGKGAVAFNKNAQSLGPAGGSGGLGGSVYALGASDLSLLGQFRYKKIIGAQNGQDGKTQFCDGATGKDLVLQIPVGTVIHNKTTKLDIEITKIGEKILLARGGKGGKGNFLFRSSINTSPRQSQPGLPGEEYEFELELKLIADIGFVGLPNVGKSSLLNELTNANSKVANYQFTTLEPNLGMYYELVLADIPGLIEDSSVGKGLGFQFLRHIERTQIIFHFVCAESVDVEKDYKTIRKELGSYNKALLEKSEYVFLTKTDNVSEDEVKEKVKVLKKLNPEILAISVYDDKSLEKVRKLLNVIKKEKFIKAE